MKKVITKHGIRGELDLFTEFQNTSESVYEVIRVMNGIALFLEDHFERLKNSIIIKGFELVMPYGEFKKHIAELIKVNNCREGNIKFVCYPKGSPNGWFFSVIPHSYPHQHDYRSGVSVELLNSERENPNAKVMQQKLRDKANQLITDLNIYEVLLVDREGRITEGSRSNVFFVKDQIFYTAPGSKVLEGITRQKVIICLAELGFQLVEIAVLASDVANYDAAFLTGTSPKVLPIRLIGKQPFDTQQPAVTMLMDSYNAMIDKYVKSERTSA